MSIKINKTIKMIKTIKMTKTITIIVPHKWSTCHKLSQKNCVNKVNTKGCNFKRVTNEQSYSNEIKKEHPQPPQGLKRPQRIHTNGTSRLKRGLSQKSRPYIHKNTLDCTNLGKKDIRSNLPRIRHTWAHQSRICRCIGHLHHIARTLNLQCCTHNLWK